MRKWSVDFALVFFLALSLLVIFISKSNAVSFFDSFATPLMQKAYSMQSKQNPITSPSLSSQVIIQSLQQENALLRAQLRQSSLSPLSFTAATVIGSPTFIPGVTPIETLIVDKGEENGIHIGQTVIVGNLIVGKITSVTKQRAAVAVLSNNSVSLTGKTQQTNASGVIKGLSNGQILFDNVVQTDTLKKGDIVLTKGDSTLQGAILPPNLIVGKINAINEKSSEVFQTAQVTPLVSFENLTMVFILNQ